MAYNLQELQKQFFEDPRWAYMEELILEYINPLLEMDTIDITQPAEAVKAEIIGRRLAYEKLMSFLSQSKIIGSRSKDITNQFN